jgi:hypothetical protein
VYSRAEQLSPGTKTIGKLSGESMGTAVLLFHFSDEE